MKLKDIREDKDLTQEQIAKILNCKQNTYQQYEKGPRTTTTYRRGIYVVVAA